MKTEVTFDEETHAYTVDGRRVPSVTEIVGLITAGKYADTNTAMMEQAKRRGSEVHFICEAIDCGIDPDELEIPPELAGYVNAYLAFLRDWAPEWDYIEKTVYTPIYAGRADRIGTIDGHTVIVDLKTTGNMDRLSKLALLLQLTGYGLAWADMGFDMPEKTLGVQLKRDGKYTLHWSQDIREKYLKDPDSGLFLFMDLLRIQTIIGGYQ